MAKQMKPSRHNRPWNTNELLRLQREYELLELDVYTIAEKHGRSVKSILFKLAQEQITDSPTVARGYQEKTTTTESIADNNKNIKDDYNIINMNNKIEIRMTKIETTLQNITSLVNLLFNEVNGSSLKKGHRNNYLETSF
jgi:hypothetical protein